VGWRVLKDRQLLRQFPMLPLRDLIAPLVWMASFASNTVTWRGDRFTVNGGKLTRTNAP
jgi:ceramide glucosyltransferase